MAGGAPGSSVPLELPPPLRLPPALTSSPAPIASAAAKPPPQGAPSSSTASGDTSQEHSSRSSPTLDRPRRRVQWPAQVSISMTPPPESTPAPLPNGESDLSRRGSADATPANGMNENPFGTKYAVSLAASEAGSTMSDREFEEEKLAELRRQLDVFVQPGEVDGMPSVKPRSDGKPKGTATKTTPDEQLPGGIDPAAEKKAKSLISGFTPGSFGFLHRRRGFKAGRGAGEVPQEVTEADLIAKTTPVAGADGILSALIALNQANGQPGSASPSPGHSALPTPNSSQPASPTGSHSDDSDDAEERERFIAKLRARRASKNTLHHTSAAVASASKSVAGAAKNLAAHGLYPHAPRGRSSFDRPSGRSISTSNLVYESHVDSELPSSPQTRAFSAGNRSQSATTLHTHFNASTLSSISPSKRSQSGTALHQLIATESRTSRASSPSPPPSPGLLADRSPRPSIAQSFRKVGEHLGLDLEGKNSRPEAARNGAGVFGGLVMSASNIAAVASPSAVQLAPAPARPGYQLSRYSAGDAPTIKSDGSSQSLPNSPKLWPTRGRSSVDLVRTVRSAQASPSGAASPCLVPPELVAIEDVAEEADEAPLSMAMSMKKRNRKNPSSGLSLKDLPSPSLKAFNPFASPGFRERDTSPSPRRGYFFGDSHSTIVVETEEERERREWAKEKRRRRKLKEKAHQQRVFITQHVAAILSRQEFLMKLARSFMMLGAPTHRLEAQFQATARVLEVNAQSVLLPGLMLISFGDAGTHTSEVKFIKQSNGLELGKLAAAFTTYQKVIRDVISVTDASVELDELLIAPPKYRLWQQLLIGGLASSAIGPSAFYASFVDILATFPLGALLVAVQVLASRNDLYSSLFEIAIACLNAFLAAALASSKQVCFSAVASSSVVLILPGYIVLCGSLELANRSIISGSVRMVYSVLYALFLGFGLSMGSEIYKRIRGMAVEGAADYTCSALRVDAPWWRATIPQWYYFLTIPTFLLMLALRNGQPMFRRSTLIMLLIGSSGFCTNFFSARSFKNRSDISSALGATVVGVLANLWAKWTTDSAFIVSVVGVFAQLPSGLANGGLLRFASEGSSGSATTYNTGFQAAESLIEVGIGLTVGLFVAAASTNALGGGRRRGSSLHSF